MTTPLTEARETEIRAQRMADDTFDARFGALNAPPDPVVGGPDREWLQLRREATRARASETALLAALDSERAKVAELVKALEKSRWLLQTLCDEGRIDYCHADDCPEDDTCSCPLPVAINDAGRQWDAALSRARQA